MNTYLDCIPCFFKQALDAAGMNSIDPDVRRDLINEIARLIPDFDLSHSPVIMAGQVHGLIKRYVGKDDPYGEIKKTSNRKAMETLPRLREKIARAANPLRLAIEYAIAGNIIDFGAKTGLNIDDEITRIVEKEEQTISREKEELFQFDSFVRTLEISKTVLYIGDNAGEVVFDKLLVDEIHRQFPDIHIYFAARGFPIINDITTEDAYFCGIDSSAEIISSGVALPGCVLEECDPAFRGIFAESDCVISKGQGNFEALSDVERPIFFLFTAKCSVIADVVGAEVGSVLLLNKK
jgi:damage-control phosphatase, subfamily I